MERKGRKEERIRSSYVVAEYVAQNMFLRNSAISPVVLVEFCSICSCSRLRCNPKSVSTCTAIPVRCYYPNGHMKLARFLTGIYPAC